MKSEKQNKLHGYYYPLEKEGQLINLIKSGNKEKAKALLDGIFEVNCNEYHLTNTMFDFLKYDISCTMTKLIYDMGDNGSAQLNSNFITPEKTADCKSIDDLKSMMYGIIDDISDSNSNYTRNNLVGDIVDYVEKNYMIPDLSVSVISDCFNVHISYLSTTFKKQMGIGLAEYIQSVRINKAKKLLKMSNKKIEEVANDVGYFSLHTFVRVFKNSEGITPARYKKA